MRIVHSVNHGILTVPSTFGPWSQHQRNEPNRQRHRQNLVKVRKCTEKPKKIFPLSTRTSVNGNAQKAEENIPDLYRNLSEGTTGTCPDRDCAGVSYTSDIKDYNYKGVLPPAWLSTRSRELGSMVQ